MTVSPPGVIAAVAVLVALLAGCAPTKEEPVVPDERLTWEAAKADTQEMELEIAALVPADVVVSVDQREKGGLFSCDETQHNWSGATTVTVTPGTAIEPIVKDVEAHYRDDVRFEIRTRLDIAGAYEVQLMSPETAESYLIAEGTPNTIWISSSSACFTLPDGVYPGGDF